MMKEARQKIDTTRQEIAKTRDLLQRYKSFDVSLYDNLDSHDPNDKTQKRKKNFLESLAAFETDIPRWEAKLQALEAALG